MTALAFTDRPQVEELPVVDAIPVPGARATVTFEVDAADAYWVCMALADSACKWHQHWRDASSGARADLDPDSCSNISRRAWRLYRELILQEERQIP